MRVIFFFSFRVISLFVTCDLYFSPANTDNPTQLYIKIQVVLDMCYKVYRGAPLCLGTLFKNVWRRWKTSYKQTWSWLVDAMQEFHEPFHMWRSPSVKNNRFEKKSLNFKWNAVATTHFSSSLCLEICQNSTVRVEHSTNSVVNLRVWSSQFLALH